MMARRCEKCGGETRRCVWHGKRGDIIECLTCSFSWVRIRPILDRHRPVGAPDAKG